MPQKQTYPKIKCVQTNKYIPKSNVSQNQTCHTIKYASKLNVKYDKNKLCPKSNEPQSLICPNIKYAPQSFVSQNYICHKIKYIPKSN